MADNNQALLQEITTQKAEKETAQQEVARLKQEIADFKAKNAKRSTISMKVSEKGGASVYGLGRFPVTLYKSQWERLIAAIPDVEAFLKANDHLLKSKE